MILDKTAQFGPPDLTDNFVVSSSRKRTKLSSQECINSCSAPKRQCQTVDNSRVECIPNQHRGVARIFGKGVLDYMREACTQNLSHAHLLTGKVKVQIVTENTF